MLKTMFEMVMQIRDMLTHVENPTTRALIMVGVMFACAAIAYRLLKMIYKFISRRIVRHKTGMLAIVLNAKLVPRLLHVVPQFIILFFAETAFNEGPLRSVLSAFARAYFVWIFCAIFSSVLTVIYRINNYRRKISESPLKGLFQAISLIIYCMGIIGTIAILTGRSPVYILSGLTALSAVLMLIFKDSLLGFTAGITLASNRMVKIGDWIEMPSANADGNVTEISLTTVRVQNWDNTITTIPAYDLIAKSFKNWRGMEESGGRRIKRSIYIDLDSIRVATPEMLVQWQKIDLLKNYLVDKLGEVDAYNRAHPSSAEALANARKLTNIGTFRAYCVAYLQSRPYIHRGMTLIVRQLQPTQEGLPLEVYCFTNRTGWEIYENYQSDIFDHLLAIMPEFGLSSFQVTSASSIARGLRGRAEALEKTPL
ncbi:MAG: mechanosensitive ion channel family protein [Kiritimatiellia bacterium]